MNKLFALTRTVPGLHEIVVAPPPFDKPVLEGLYTNLFPIFEADAASYPNITFTTAPRASVSDAGAYAQELPCLPSEARCTVSSCAFRLRLTL